MENEFKNSVEIITESKVVKLIPLKYIKGLEKRKERDYSKEGYPDKDFAYLILDSKYALDNLFCGDACYKQYYFGNNSPIAVRVLNEYKILKGILQGDKAVKVLFNEE